MELSCHSNFKMVESFCAVVSEFLKNTRYTVLCLSDNVAVVQAMNSCFIKNPLLKCLLRANFFAKAHFSLPLRASHVAGASNSAADFHSRYKIIEFHILIPQADPSPSAISVGLLPLLRADWPSLNWCQHAAQHYFELLPSSFSARSYRSAQ